MFYLMISIKLKFEGTFSLMTWIKNLPFIADFNLFISLKLNLVVATFQKLWFSLYFKSTLDYWLCYYREFWSHCFFYSLKVFQQVLKMLIVPFVMYSLAVTFRNFGLNSMQILLWHLSIFVKEDFYSLCCFIYQCFVKELSTFIGLCYYTHLWLITLYFLLPNKR